MPSAILALSGTVTGIPEGPQSILATWNLPNAVSQGIYVTLAVGDNEIAVPTGPSGLPATVLIIPPDNNSVTIKFREVFGDTGITIHPQVPCFISLDPSVAQFWLNVGSPLAGPIRIVFE